MKTQTLRCLPHRLTHPEHECLAFDAAFDNDRKPLVAAGAFLELRIRHRLVVFRLVDREGDEAVTVTLLANRTERILDSIGNRIGVVFNARIQCLAVFADEPTPDVGKQCDGHRLVSLSNYKGR